MPQKVFGLVGALCALVAPVSWACAPASFEGGLRAASESFVPSAACAHAQLASAAPPRYVSPVPAPEAAALARARHPADEAWDAESPDGWPQVLEPVTVPATRARPTGTALPAPPAAVKLDLSQVPPAFVREPERTALMDSPAVVRWVARVTNTDNVRGNRQLQAGSAMGLHLGPLLQVLALLTLAIALLRRRWA